MIKLTDKGILLSVRVIPNSSKNSIVKETSCIKIKITASPVDNKANIALIEFLSKMLDIPKSSIELVKGFTAKEKTILIHVKEQELQKSIIDKLTK